MIGVFDSGLGGLTVARELIRELPDYSLIYFGDTARSPYGSKSAATVIRYSIANANFLLDRGAQLIVVACNTASSLATSALKERFSVPIFEVISPAVQMVVSNRKSYRVGIIGTRATVNSGVYEQKIRSFRPEIKVLSNACPLLVPLVEEGWIKKPETRRIVKKYLHPLKMRQIDTLILACTHYPLLKDIIQAKIGKRVKIIDSSQAIARDVKKFIEQHPEIKDRLDKRGQYQIYVSDVTEHFQEMADTILKNRVTLKRISI
nr:glutamate racemase [Desulfobacterales bacterium]